jgi:dienelactone hydrolase
MAIWSSEIKELEKLYESLKGQLPALGKELEQLIKFDDPNVIMLYSRRCLEVIITDLCECELKRPRGTEPLKGIIDKLHKERKVPDYISTSMHGLNDLSTYGTHPKDFDPEQVKPVLINLDIIIKWYLKHKGFLIKSIPKPDIHYDKIKPGEKRRLTSSGKPGILVPVIFMAIILLGTIIFFLNRHSKIKWAKEKAIPEIERLHNEDDQVQAFNLVQKAEKYISKDPKLRKLSSLVTSYLTVLTDPPGADVYIREYSDIKGEWKRLGTTPIDSAKFPGASLSNMTRLFFMMRIEKPGYEDVLAVSSNIQDTLYRKLFKPGTIPPGMIYVEGFKEEVKKDFDKEKHGFFIDRYEVTNRQYKEFVDSGGYRDPKYWKNEFKKDGKIITWDEAITYFTDKTGRPGPSTWEAGDYPDGQDDYPVSGISWYEAAAYAEHTGKSLPTEEHWYSATGYYYYFIQKSKSLIFLSKIIPISNLNHTGSEPVGKNRGITWFGAFDMAGNVREWCWNETPVGHIIRGGAWNDESYSYYESSQLPSIDRSSKNGFRCAKYIDKEKIPEVAFQPITYKEIMDFSKEIPVSEDIFKIYKNQFLYDSTDLKAVIEDRINNSEEWTAEKISFNAAYGKERIIAYLFLPKNSSPPFQTIIFFPGSFATREKDLIGSPERKWFTDYLLKSGRAVMCPVYKYTFERSDEPMVYEGHQWTEGVIKWVKDFKRTIDYLETRLDIDKSRLGFYGYSWGGIMGGIIPAVEERLKVNILIVGGIYEPSLPEVNDINYIPRIKMPTLMLNGRYDYTFPLEINVEPFFKRLGTPEKDKRLVICETDHYVLKNDMIKEVLDWLDKYFGPVKYKNQ